MSRSHAEIIFNNREITISAEFIELMAHYLAREVESNGIQNYSDGMKFMYKMCIEYLLGDPVWGGNYFFLNDLKSNEDKSEFTILVNSTKSIISNIGEEIPVSTLLAIESQNKPDISLREQWSKPVKTRSLNNLLEATLKLVQDESYEGMWAVFEGWEDDFGGKANTELTIL